MGFLVYEIGTHVDAFELAASRVRVVEVFWAQPDVALVERARRAGGPLVAWQAGSVQEATAAEDIGCDFVVAQGVEAGGHIRGPLPGAERLRLGLRRLRIPVFTAGGLA